MKLGADGRVRGLRLAPSPKCDDRPAGTPVTLLVVHAISLPPGHYGGDAIERLFTNRLDPAEHPYYREIAHLRVSAHFLVHRDGALVQFVPIQRRAWHAGVSSWRSRASCNDFSIGVELEGCDDDAFSPAQYDALAALARALRAALPLRDFAAHSEIAPGRKTDPGPRFDARRFLAALAAH